MDGLKRRQGGAALLIAMVILALVATLASAMVWQQWRAIQVEAAERARAQASWILIGASDWARLILGESRGSTDNLGQPWALPLQEARLSTFLAADKDNTDDGPEAFLSGAIVDAQSRYNLRNLANIVPTGAEDTSLVDEIKLLAQLLDSIGVNGGELAPRITTAMRAAFKQTTTNTVPANTTTVTAEAGTYLQPQTVAQLAWFGIDDDTLARMAPYFTILPLPTLVNINTAPKEVLAAVAGIDPGTAQQWVQRRQGKPFDNVNAAVTAVTPGLSADRLAFIGKHLDMKSSYFEVHGRLRLSDRVLEETSLVRRDTGTRIVTTIQRRRESLREVTG